MSLASIKQDLIKAHAGHYAVPLLDVFETYGMEGLMDALMEKRAPTIIGIYSPFPRWQTALLWPLTSAAAQRRQMYRYPSCWTTGPPEQCIQVISYGYTDVMYDGSKLPIEENIANTRKVVEHAHGWASRLKLSWAMLDWATSTSSLAAKALALQTRTPWNISSSETGVDILAIAFGNAHGLYRASQNWTWSWSLRSAAGWRCPW